MHNDCICGNLYGSFHTEHEVSEMHFLRMALFLYAIKKNLPQLIYSHKIFHCSRRIFVTLVASVHFEILIFSFSVKQYSFKFPAALSKIFNANLTQNLQFNSFLFLFSFFLCLINFVEMDV